MRASSACLRLFLVRSFAAAWPRCQPCWRPHDGESCYHRAEGGGNPPSVSSRSNPPGGSPMALAVFDYRTDVRNLFITPEMRARVIRREPGTAGGGHTHDLGHELFLVLEGQAEFTIA